MSTEPDVTVADATYVSVSVNQTEYFRYHTTIIHGKDSIKLEEITPDSTLINPLDYTAKYIILFTVILIFGLNGGLFIWRAVKSRRDPTHAILVGNLAISHLFAGLYVLLPFLDTALRKTGVLSRTPRRFCEIMSFLQMFSFMSTIGSLFVMAVDRVYYFRHSLRVTGTKSCVAIAFSILIWLLSIISASIFALFLFFYHDPRTKPNSFLETYFCWQGERKILVYFIAVELWVALAVFLLLVVMYCTLLFLRCRYGFISNTRQSLNEENFLLKASLITGTTVLVWLMLPVSVAIESSSGYLRGDPHHWLYLLSTVLPSLVNPVVYLLTSLCCRDRRIGSSFVETKKSTLAWTSTKREVSIRLSTYLESGETLTTRDAFIMTSCLSTSIHTLHTLGMAANSIDPQHILVERDAKGTLVDTHLIGVPIKPRKDSLAARIEEDKEAIGQLFDCFMAHTKESNNQLLSPNDRRQTSVRLLKTLSVRQPAARTSPFASPNIRRQMRPKTWKV